VNRRLIRRIEKPGLLGAMAAPGILVLLEKLCLTEEDWLLFGKIWRIYGAKDPQASFRKQDQYISIKHFHDFIGEIKEIFPLDINCDDLAEVANLEVPVAKFYKDDFKLHRRDVGLALIKYNPTFKKMNQKDKSQFLDEFEDCMNQRYPTRAIMDDEYFVETTKEYFKQKRNHNTQIQ